MNFPKIIVLSLPQENLRRANIQSQLESRGLAFSFFDALTPEQLPEKIPEDTRLTQGEYCCAKCHNLIYSVAKNHNYTVILEDDAILQENFDATVLEIINIIENLNKKPDVIILGYSKIPPEDKRKIFRFNPLKIKKSTDLVKLGHPHREWKCGTVAYLVTKTGASKLSSLTKNIIATADDWNHFRNNDIEIWHSNPLLVLEGYRNFDSAIEKERMNFKENNPLFNIIRYARGFARSIKLAFS
ncbi:glycosyltransferase family 25 protein [Pseudomonas schmalbachii]|uniref:Glycosyltransferase family 25 protein n=1 Tax=Pseudomonas schmalbachii TaxID=2816993 RepID=A0ABS3TU05_9PSED|nr:glycosyltransferase family 25 protein [Pseudomonas schmalbachii]MBO3277150.1 glycosyltransferase family 25 protein [Pseudomonas schmalbachii]